MNAVANKCLNCHGTGTRSWPQSRNTNPRNPLEREQLAPQITKCGACAGTGFIYRPGQSVTWTTGPERCGCFNNHGQEASFRRYLDADHTNAEIFTCRGSVNVRVADIVAA
ncbi:hypothetical protein ACXJJ3_32925 [Kribbella sp. WER1]